MLIIAAAPQLLISSKADKCCKCGKNIWKIFVTRFHPLKSTFPRKRLHQQPPLFNRTLFCLLYLLKYQCDPFFSPQISFLDWPTGLRELYPTAVSVADLEIKFYLLLFQIRVASGHGRRFVFPFRPIPAKGKRVQDCNVWSPEKEVISAITDHPSDRWSLLAGGHWSHNDHSERLCAVGAAGGQGEVSTNRARRRYVAWIERDDKADSPPSHIFCWRMLVAGGS